jgi:glycosyltransferase involved in cell wall biosynthesis
MRVLAVSKIFPSSVEPLSAPFNRQQLAALGRLCDVEVLATVPWFPLRGRSLPPRREIFDGRPLEHPRTLYVPGLPSASAALYAASLLPSLLARRTRFDVLLAAWAYPDGAAAIALGRLLGVPVVVKAHGSDLNVVAKMPGPRAQLRVLLPRAARVVAVSRALADEAVALGVDHGRVRVVGNGVDGDLFFPRDRAACRRELGLSSERRVVYVGRLQREKGLFELVDAVAEQSSLRLSLVGDGPARQDLAARAAQLGGRVTLEGAQPLARVPVWMGAADVVTLPSWNEGTPNVLLEAIACGRPVVATRVGGIPDVVSTTSLGELVPPRDAKSLGAALTRVAAATHDAQAIATAGRRGWDDSAKNLLTVLEEARA